MTETIEIKKDSILTIRIKTFASEFDSIQTYNRNVVLLIQKRGYDSVFISNTKHSYKFDSAHFKINKGRLIGTYFYLKDTGRKAISTIFFNNEKKVSVTSKKIHNEISQYELRSFTDPKEQIVLSNYFLMYPNINKKGNDYYPSDTVISFKRSDSEFIKKIYVTRAKLENYVEFDMLSDIQGLNKDNPNGLIQIEGRASLTLNRQFLSNTNLRFCYNIIPFIQFNKIDNTNRNLPVLTISTDSSNQKYVNTVNLWQYSNLTFGAKLNLVRWDANFAQNNLFIDMSSMIIRTSIIDSIPSLVNRNVYSFIWGAALKFRVKPINNIPFWADFSIGLNSLTLLDQNIRQRSKNMYRQGETTQFNVKENNFWDKFLMVPQIELFIKISDTKYFIRGVFPSDLIRTENSFLQVQFGISILPQRLNEYLKMN